MSIKIIYLPLCSNMKKSILLISLVFFLGCGSSSGDLYKGYKCKIVSIEESYKRWLLKSIEDSTLYADYSFMNDDGDGKKDSIFYSRSLGDTVRFDYILKTRFFHLNKKKYLDRYKNLEDTILIIKPKK